MIGKLAMIGKGANLRRALALGVMLSVTMGATIPLAACGREGVNVPPADIDPQAETLQKGRDIHGHR
jgi:predicted small lipoprotein YifL